MLQFATFKLTAWLPTLPLHCLSPSLRDQLLFFMLAPLAVAALAVAIGAAVTWLSEPSKKITAMKGFEKGSAAHLLLPSLPFVLIWTFLLFPPVSSLGFRALAPCECFEYDVVPAGTNETKICFLSTDRSVICEPYRDTYRAPASVLHVAFATVLVWAVGVPALNAALLYAAREPLSRRRPPTHLSEALGFLAAGYGPRAPLNHTPLFWWEIIELMKKLSITGFLALVSPGSLLQLYLAVIVALCFFAIELYIQPFDSLMKTFLSLISGFALVLTLIGTLGFELVVRDVNHSYLTSDLMLGVLIGAGVVVFFASLCALLVQTILAARRQTLRLVSTNEEPLLMLPDGCQYSAFISHVH